MVFKLLWVGKGEEISPLSPCGLFNICVVSCTGINPCVKNNGNCHKRADCLYLRPGRVSESILYTVRNVQVATSLLQPCCLAASLLLVVNRLRAS